MNSYVESQIRNMINTTVVFKKSCQLAATMDDKNISKDEAKLLKKINSAADKFQKELNDLLSD